MRRPVFALFFLLLLTVGLQSQTLITKISPKSDQVLFESHIVFEWNEVPLLGINPVYSITLATDSLLSNVIYSNGGLSQTKDSFVVSVSGNYYWQVKALDQNLIVGESSIFSFRYLTLNDLSSISIHLRADSGVLLGVGNQIVKWLNLADTSKSALSASSSAEPTLSSIQGLNNRPVVNFDGVDDLMEINSSIGFSELFVVANWGSGSATFPSYNGLISGTSSYYALIANGAGGSQTDFLNSAVFPTVKINGQITRDFAPLEKFKIINSYRSTTFQASDFQIGRDRSFTSRHWNGGVAEVIGFTNQLNDSLREIVNSYLCEQYGKRFSFQEDIELVQSLCDTTVIVDSTYSSYLWSNGDTTYFSDLSVGQSYTLTVTDSMGCRFSDEISIRFPIGMPSKNLLCGQDSILWNTHLSNAEYSFNWSGGSSDSALMIKSNGSYVLTVTDNQNCTFVSDSVHVIQDTSFNQLSLGADTSLCAQDFIALQNANDTLLSYLWSTGDTISSTRVQLSGQYYITVDNGVCSFVDSVGITIIGQAPTVNFTAKNLFANDSVAFTDLSIAAGLDVITEWNWDFGDGNTSIKKDPKHYYSSVGTYTIRLTVRTQDGCTGSFAKQLDIVLKPPTIAKDTIEDKITLVLPNRDDVVFDSLVVFKWNSSFYQNSTSYYVLSVATDSLMTNLVHSDSLNINSDTLAFNQPNLFYWRIDLIDTTGLLLQSEVSGFWVSDIFDLNGLSFFFRADTGLNLVQTNELDKWLNLADTSRSLQAPTANARPISSLNSQIKPGKVIRFDGSDDFMLTDSSFQLAEVYTVAKWGGMSTSFPNFNGLLSGQSSYFIFTADASISNSTRFLLGSFPNMTANKVQTRDFAPIDKFKILGATKPTPTLFPDFQVGRDRQFSTRHWNGDIAEIIGFSNPLTDSAKAILDAYLCQRYAEPLELGEDVFISYGYCDTIITVDSIYQSYVWSNGDTTNYSKLLPGKAYSLTVTDDFGCEFTDQISVVVPIRSREDQMLCLQDTFIWDTGLPTTSYSFEWNTGDTDSSLTIDQPGNYYLIIEDTLGCSIQLDSIIVQYDSSLIEFNLGSDTAICKGEQILLDQPSLPISSYLWSTGNQNNSIRIDTTGFYALTVSNGRCIESDTIHVTIKGRSPRVNFNFGNSCVFDTVMFTDASIAYQNDSLTAWKWMFSDGTILNTDTVAKPFSHSGSTSVRLEVLTFVGCIGDTTIQVPIHPKPNASFAINKKCSKTPIEFFDQSAVSTGSIISYDWNFGDTANSSNTSGLQDPSHVYDTLGNYLIKLIVESNEGCLDTVTQSKYINPTPVVDFIYEGNCEGDSTYLIDQTILPNARVDRYLWIITHPLQPLSYSDSIVGLKLQNFGKYPVQLNVRSDSLCSSTYKDTIQIDPSPIANFSTGTFCSSRTFELLNRSTILEDSIVTYQYVFNGTDTSSNEHPSFLSTNVGLFDVKLNVESNKGCKDSIVKQITIAQQPEAAFKILNNNSGIPFTVYLLNESQDAQDYYWFFGNGDSLTGFEPQYTYSDTGTYLLTLVAETTIGCKDTVSKTLVAAPYHLDVNMSKLFLSENLDNGLEAAVQVQNVGRNNVEKLKLVLNVNDEIELSEEFDVRLFSGDQRVIDFSNSIIQTVNGKVNFVCARIVSVNDVMDDVTSNNEQCEKGFGQAVFIDYFPNPTASDVRFNYTLPQEGDVSLELFDRLGKEVLPSFNAYQKEGYYSMYLNTSGLNAGVYIYQFVFNGQNYNGVIVKTE